MYIKLCMKTNLIFSNSSLHYSSLYIFYNIYIHIMTAIEQKLIILIRSIYRYFRNMPVIEQNYYLCSIYRYFRIVPVIEQNYYLLCSIYRYFRITSVIEHGTHKSLINLSMSKLYNISITVSKLTP